MLNTNMDSFNAIWSSEDFPLGDVLLADALDNVHVF
jgi:hypothetical protein